MAPRQPVRSDLRLRVFGLATMAAGLILVIAAIALPVVGETLLELVRGRPITAPEARQILGRIWLAGAVAAAINGAALLSSGALWLRAVRRGQISPVRRSQVPAISAAAAVTVIACGAIFAATEFHLARRSLTFDEILAVEADVQAPWTRTLNPRALVNHISGSVLAKLSRAGFGESEPGLRSASIVLSACGLAGVGLWVLRETGNAGAAIWLVTALGTNALVLNVSGQIRGYSALMWMGAATVLLSAPAPLPSTGRARFATRMLALGGAGILLGLSHLFGLFYLGALTGMVHVRSWFRTLGADHETVPTARAAADRSEAATGATLAWVTTLATLAWMPAFPWLFYFTGSRVASRPQARLPDEVSRLFFGQPGWGHGAALALLVLGLAGAVVWKEKPTLRVLAAVGTLPLLALLAMAFLTKPAFFFARFLLLGLVLWCVIAACAGATLVQKTKLSARWRAILAAFLVLATLGCLARPTAELLRDRRGYREAARDLESLLARVDPSGRGRIFPMGGWESQTIVRFYLPSRLILDTPDIGIMRSRRETGIADLAVWIGDAEMPGEQAPLLSAMPVHSRTEISGSRWESPFRVLVLAAGESSEPAHRFGTSRQTLLRSDATLSRDPASIVVTAHPMASAQSRPKS